MLRLGSLIPPVSATELGVFRLALRAGTRVGPRMTCGCPTRPFHSSCTCASIALAEWEWVHALAAQPALVAQLEWAMVAMALVFSVGLFSRLTFVALVLAITVWTLVRLTHTGAHNWSALFVTLWAMLPVRWDAGFSLACAHPAAAGSRRRRVSGARAYGYALWVPGLVFGAAMAGAGTAKLVQSGLAVDHQRQREVPLRDRCATCADGLGVVGRQSSLGGGRALGRGHPHRVHAWCSRCWSRTGAGACRLR